MSGETLDRFAFSPFRQTLRRWMHCLAGNSEMWTPMVIDEKKTHEKVYRGKMNRRRFLECGGTALAVGFAGCSAIDAESREGVILTHIELGNATDELQMFDVIVRYDGNIMHWETYEVAPGTAEQEMGGEVIEIDHPPDPGRVEVSVRVGQHWERTDFDSDRFDGKHVIVVATYAWPEEGALRLSRVDSDRPPSGTN